MLPSFAPIATISSAPLAQKTMRRDRGGVSANDAV
jgi:hypothetical protein